jgi:hypothetical protein
MWRMFGALIAGMIGIAMVFWALERTTLVAAGSLEGNERAPWTVYVTLFAGLIAVSFAVLFVVSRWSRFLRDNPETKQIPVWLAIAIIVLAGAGLVAGIAIHASWLQDQDPVPDAVSDGFIMYEVLMSTLVLVPLVLVGVRWAPGYAQHPGVRES